MSHGNCEFLCELKVLVADDDASVRQSLKLIFFGEDIEIEEAATLTEAEEKILRGGHQLVLFDVHFQNGATCLPLLQKLQIEKIEVPLIVLSGAASASEAVQAVHFGAYDFLEKPVQESRLRLVMERCLEEQRLKSVLKSLAVQDGRSAAEFLGSSADAQAIRSKIERFAKRDMSVLITGETGTGKEVVAQSVRALSSRQNKIFVSVNAAAIPEALIESELFGHKKGSFSGAVSDSLGKIGAADGGIVFLDEIGDLSMAAQAKLLRFLETGEIQRVGAVQTQRVDVRVIAATSRDLQKDMKKNLFRADLYYRLCVADIHISPLRSRPEDIEVLFLSFVQRFALRHKTPLPSIEPGALAILKSYSWPGNVRELRNIAERLIVHCDQTITLAAVQDVLPSQIVSAESVVQVDSGSQHLVTLKQYKSSMEQKYIQQVLEACAQNVTQAAKILGIDRAYLYSVMARLGIQRKTESD